MLWTTARKAPSQGETACYTPDMPRFMDACPFFLSLAASGLTNRIARRHALAGAVLAALAVASLAVAGGEEWRSASLPPSYFATTAAMLLLAGGLTLAGGVAEWRSRPLASVALSAGILAALVTVAQLTQAAGIASTVLAVGVLAGATLLSVVVVVKVAGPAIDRVNDWWRAREAVLLSATPATRSLRLLVAHLALTLAALSVGHLHLILLMVLLGAVTGWAFERPVQGRGRSAIGLVVCLIALIPAWYFLSAVAGDTPLGFAALADAPYSDSFEILVTPFVLLGVWPLLHLAPFHAARQGPAAPVLGALLIFRLGPTALAGGLVHWQPVIFLLLVLAALAALVRRNDTALMTTLGLAGILSLEPMAEWTGLGLIVLECVLAGARRLMATGFRLTGIGQLLGRLVPVAGVALLLPTLAGMLEVEVVYSVALVLVAVLALSRQPSALSRSLAADG